MSSAPLADRRGLTLSPDALALVRERGGPLYLEASAPFRGG